MPRFEIVGQLPGPWKKDLDALVERAENHRWGGEGLERLLVVPLTEGGLITAFEEWMPSERLEAWRAVQEGRPVATGAITFAARDGRLTAAVPAWPDPGAFLGMAVHEHLEGNRGPPGR